MQINLTGFLEGRNAREFMGELWDLLLSAQNSPDGIPPILVELKKEELRKKQVSMLIELKLISFERKNSSRKKIKKN
ncbi:hypothetical protein B4U79_11354 [Dinothrombium tinctorium]|uniref:PWI domain-containing protein n=1 Tax=Dinothrombium tinctorium TaxID=1965070 RepID=A0A443QLM1_9ACAR|nr:hypothetical protein B4U79_11354 [Dinothrombium tinctorium]